MKHGLGHFCPRPEYGWPQEPSRQCHILGSLVVGIQGHMGMAEIAARNNDYHGVWDGLWGIKFTASELKGKLPEVKEQLRAVENRAKMLEVLISPYAQKKLPEKISGILSSQIRALDPYGTVIEKASILKCGGQPGGAHQQMGELEPLPPIPKGMIREARKLKAARDAKDEARNKRYHERWMKKFKKRHGIKG